MSRALRATLPFVSFALLAVFSAAGLVHGKEPGIEPAQSRLAPLRLPPQEFRLSLAGKGRIDGQRVRFHAGLGVSQQGFRIDLFHPLTGGTLLSIGMAGPALAAVWPESRECLQGGSGSISLADLVGLPLAADELPPFLSGRGYSDPSVRIIALQARGKWLDVEAEHVASGARLQVRLHGRRPGRVVRVVRTPAGEGPPVSAEYRRWRGAPQAPYPTRIRLKSAAAGLSLLLKVRERAAGGPPAAALLPRLPGDCRPVGAEELRRRGPWSRPGAR